MKNNKRYFEEALSNVNERFFNAGGDFEFSESFGESLNADGGAGAPAQPTSQPYIINIQNTSTTDVNNVVVLGAYSNLIGATNFGNPTAIQIAYGLTNVSYTEFLWQTTNKPFKVGLTYLQSSNNSQVLSTFTLTHKDANGNLADKPIVPIIDPYQQQSGNLAVRLAYTVDGFTKFTFSTILASTTLKLYMYPSEKVDLRNAVAGFGASTGYSAPQVSNQQKLTLSSASIAALTNGKL